MSDVGRTEWLPDIGAGDWIAAHLRRLDGTVGQTVPAVFDAYARILHPPRNPDDRPGTWAEVCARTGATAHKLMQWHTIIRTHSATGRSGSPPEEGNLPAEAMATLLDVLAHPTGDQRCVFALWEGWGWVDARGASVTRTLPDGSRITEEPPSAFPPEILDGPRLQLPGRRYLLFTGPLTAATGFEDPLGIRQQSPSLFWPEDRSWCVPTEIDFDSTLVGGSRELIAGVLAAPGLEAWPVGPDDSLARDADTVNA